MITETQWDLEVDVVCLGAEGGVLAAGIVASNAGFDVFLGIMESADGGGDLATPVGYRGGDRPRRRSTSPDSTTHSGAAVALRRFWPVRAVEDFAPPRSGRNAEPSNRSSAQRSSSGPVDVPRRRTACSTTG